MLHSFVNPNRRVLSLDEIRAQAPSVFATQPHHEVSDKYTFIPTIDMLRTLMAEGWEVTQAGQHLVRKHGKAGYQKHLLRLRNPNLPRIGDSEVELIAFNSHDRTSCFKFLGGLFRFVCANGMCVGETLFEPISVRHIGYRAENALAAAMQLVQSVPRISTSVGEMQGIELDTDERLAFAEAALTLKYDKDENGKVKSPITADKLLMARRHDDTKRDLWTTFNVIQENSIKGGQRGWSPSPTTGRLRRQSTRAVGSITENSKLNQALWTLAERMKELKTGQAA